MEAYIPLVLLSIFLLVFGVWNLVKSPDYSKPVTFITLATTFAEIAFVFVCPPIGILTTNDTCGEHPFANQGIDTALTLWAVFAVAYGCSRYLKNRLAPLLALIIHALLVIGTIFCLVVAIHFGPFVLLFFFPGIGLLVASPVFCFVFGLKEILRCVAHYRGLLEQRVAQAEEDTPSIQFYRWLSQYHFLFSFCLTAPFIVLIQAALYVFGQRPDSIITQFTESCGFLLSHYQNCSCGGDHYLCSIAANGNKKLVRPVRFGLRQNQRIVVNRQLLIANAFEHWMEQYVPRIHRVVRGTYDAMRIPVNRWAKHRRMANLIYVGMKPLEWFFLLWLYLFDLKPENRIATQYFPKNDYENYKILKTQILNSKTLNPKP